MKNFHHYFETLRSEIISEFNGNEQSIKGASEFEIRLAENQFSITLPSCYVDWLKVFGGNVMDILNNSAGNYTLKDFIYANTMLSDIRMNYKIIEEINCWIMIGIYIEGYVFTGFYNSENSNEIGYFHVPDQIDKYKIEFAPFIRNHLISSIWERIISNRMISKGEIPKNGKWIKHFIEYIDIVENSKFKYDIYENVGNSIEQIEQQQERFLTIQEVVLQKKEIAKKLIKEMK